jgi:3-oxoacyl-[acyl-carrier protein] reductase
MELGLRGKVAIVAGSSKGIGRAVARELAAEGCRITLCARREAELLKAADELRQATGAEVQAVPADVTRYMDIKAVVQRTADAYGRIDILFTNAGGPPAGLFDTITDENWEEAFELNLLSAVRMIREVVPHMRRGGGGRIVNLTSTSVKQPIDGLILSNSIRMGVVGLAKTLSQELAKDNITVNTVCPGRILTDRLRSLMATNAERAGKRVEEMFEAGKAEIPLRRYGAPEEIASMVAFLASDRAGYVTGVTVQVDGGLIRGVL